MYRDKHWSEIIDMVNASKPYTPLKMLDQVCMQKIEKAVFKCIDEQLADACGDSHEVIAENDGGIAVSSISTHVVLAFLHK